MNNRWLTVLFALVMGFTALTYSPAVAQDATPEATTSVVCDTLPEGAEFTILVLAKGEIRPAGTIIILREKVKIDDVNVTNVRADCLQVETEITADAWEGYPSMAYAAVDACIEAQRFQASNPTREVRLDSGPVPETCFPEVNAIPGDTSLQAEIYEIVPAGTISVVREVDFVQGTATIYANELPEDLEAVWNQRFHRQIWYGYTSMAEAMEGACANGRDLFTETAVPWAWDEDFKVTVNGKTVTSVEEVCS